MLWRLFENNDGTEYIYQLVIPSALKSKILRDTHEGILRGHSGIDKCLCKLKERFYWPGQYNDVKQWCSTCVTSATRKPGGVKRRGPLQPVIAGYPLQLVAVDILGPLPVTSQGNSYILVAEDYFTRWLEAWPIPNREIKTVAQKLLNEIFFSFLYQIRFYPIRDDNLRAEQWRNCVNCNRLKSHGPLRRWIGGDDEGQSYIVEYVIYGSGGAPGGVWSHTCGLFVWPATQVFSPPQIIRPSF